MKEIFLRGDGINKRIQIDPRGTALTTPVLIPGEPGIGQRRWAFCGEHLPDGTEIWTTAAAVMRDIIWKANRDAPPESSTAP